MANEIEICAVGGYSEVGRNMTAVKIGNEAVIFDMGINVQKIMDFEEEKENLDENDMVRIGATPDDSAISDWKDNVKAILLTHAHLDHIAGIPYLSQKYNCPIIATPFTIEVLKQTINDTGIKVPNKLIAVNPNSRHKLSENLEAEFIEITHSTPQSAMIALHTKKGTLLYTNDYKFDDHPVLGNKTDYDKLKSLAPIFCLITDSLYASREGKTPSESVAKELLKEIMLETENKNGAIIVTTFASHIARIKSAIELGEKIHRKIYLLGRSLHKYVKAAENVGIVKFSDKTHIIGFSSKIKRKLKMMQKNRSHYLIICTGNQGEKNSTLDKMAKGCFHFKPADQIIFSCKTIPTEPNITQRARLEAFFRKKKVRLYLDVHSSGHCSSEDSKELIALTKPKHIIPAHGDEEKRKFLQKLAEELNYKPGKTVHLLKNGQKIRLE